MLVDLRLTMESGQPPQFIWKQEGDRYWRYVEGGKCCLWQDAGPKKPLSLGFRRGGGKCCLWQDAGLRCTPGYEGYVREFLRAGDDLEEIYTRIATDAVMRAAVKKYWGLRITKNDPWETLVSFVCSINNNIPRIRRNVQSLMQGGRMLTPEELLERDLRRYKLGFRADFLKGIAEHMASYDLEGIGRLGYEEAKAALLELPGVGDKVAECVLLFGYGFLEAFPVDVWISRAMARYYGVRGRKKIAEYARKTWGSLAGYAQQYLYCAIRGL